MGKKYFSLSSVENNKLIKIVQIVFGVLCLAVAIYWVIFNIRLSKADKTLWITILFLSGFGLYMIWAGLGKAVRFIELRSASIILKKTVLRPAIELAAADIQKIEIYPFNLIFKLKTEKKILLRFSSTYYETNEKIKDEIVIFGELNSINVEFVEEKI